MVSELKEVHSARTAHGWRLVLPLLLLQLGGLAHCATAETGVPEAVVHYFEKEQLSYIEKLFAAKRQSPALPVKALAESALRGEVEEAPPMDVDVASRDPEVVGEALLSYADKLYVNAQYIEAEAALGQIAASFQKSAAERIDLLRLRLALRGIGKFGVVYAVRPGSAPELAMNQALATAHGTGHVPGSSPQAVSEARQDTIGRLKRLLAQPMRTGDSMVVRQRAALWLSLLLQQNGQSQEARSALSALDADSPLLVDVLLTWLRLRVEASPAAVGAVEQKISALAPHSPAAWEARSALVHTLLAQGAVAQSGEVLLDGYVSITEQLANLEQQIARAATAPLTELAQLYSLLPELHKQRVISLLQSRGNLLAHENLLNGWMPYLHAYRSQLQRDPGKFADDIRDFLRESGDEIRRRSDAKEMLGLFKFKLRSLVGAPAEDGLAYLLFAGLSRWEFEQGLPRNWRPAEDGTGMAKVIDQAAQLLDLLGTQSFGVAAADGADIALQLKQVYERNSATVAEIRALIPRIESGVQREVLQGLHERRRITQQWLNRYAFDALAVLSRHEEQREEVRFDLGSPLTMGRGEKIVPALEKMTGGQIRRKTGALNMVPLWSALKGVIENSENEQIRVDALRLRGQLTLALHELRAIPSAHDAVAHYSALLKQHGQLIDRAEVMYQLARAQELAQKPAQSLETLAEFSRTFLTDPRSIEATFRIGDVHFSAGDFQLARPAYQQTLARGESRYRDAAEYKLGWTFFKLGEFREALPRFFAVVDRAAESGVKLDKARKNRVKDSFRAISLTFLAQGGATGVEQYFNRAGKRSYLADIYASLGQLYLERDRINDAANAYGTLVKNYPNDARSPALLAGAAKGARRSGLAKLALELQEQFVDRYAITEGFWKQADEDTRQEILPEIRLFLPELTSLYHADAQQRQSVSARNKALRYYSQFIETFPADRELPRMIFLRAEARFEAGDFANALVDYDRSAYDFGQHDKAAEASYASLITSQKLIDQELDPLLRKTRLRALVAKSGRFAGAFVGDTRVDAVLVKAGEDILMLGEPADAVTLGESLLARQPSVDVRRRAQTLYAHGLFETNAFAPAETAYRTALAFSGVASIDRRVLTDRLGLSIYRQAEAQRKLGHASLAADSFLRVAEAAPGSELIPSAEIDAVGQLLIANRVSESITAMERFLKDYSNHSLALTVPTRLAFAYEKSGKLAKAADMLEVMSQSEGDPALARQAVLRAAELRGKSGLPALAEATYERYLARFPNPLEAAVEVKHTLSLMAAGAGDIGKRDRWLVDIISVQAKSGAEATPRTRFLAAQSNVILGDTASSAFDEVKLKLPLDKTLAEKRRTMEVALKLYDKAGAFGVAEVTTAATYKTGEMYRRLARDMLASERPGGLNELEKAQYKILLEEEALPFEDKAAQLHQLNLERIAGGVYDQWVKRSLGALGELLPARYERSEISEQHFDYVLPKPLEMKDEKPAGKGKGNA